MTELTLLTQSLKPTEAELAHGANELLKLNRELSENNLHLTETQAREIAETRLTALRQNSRIEIGMGATTRIIKKFSSSAYVTNQNLPEIINFLCDIFYFLKTETRDSISDTELIDKLFDKFETDCAGSTEHLSDECEDLIRSFNLTGSADFTDENNEPEENIYAD